MIMSVSTLTTGSGAATPVSLVNFSMICLRTDYLRKALKQILADLKNRLALRGTAGA
jgi:hypothetical protein